MLNDGGRDEKACIFKPRGALEGHSNDLSILEDWPPRVAWVDGRVGLNSQEASISWLDVIDQLDAADHPTCEGNLLTACGITNGIHYRPHLGQHPYGQGIQTFKKGGILYREDSQVTIMSDVGYLGQVGAGVLKASDLNLLGPADDMSVGYDSIALDDEA